MNWDEAVAFYGEKQKRQLANLNAHWADEGFSLLEFLAMKEKEYADARRKPTKAVGDRHDRLKKHVVGLMDAGYDGYRLHSKLKATKQIRNEYFSGIGDGDQTLRRDIKAVKRGLLKSHTD